MQAIITKTATHQQAGEYTQTAIDAKKQEVDFLLVQTLPYYIRWNKTGKSEIVTARQLAKLQATHTWLTDF